MRHHTEQMQLPRFLWVPFPLGRPFGAPHAPDFQRRVLHTALSLLERDQGPVLVDFPDDAPATAAEAGDAAWSCPISFPTAADDRPALVVAALDEIERLEPWLEQRASSGHPDFAPIAPLSLREVVEAFGALIEDGALPDVGEMPLQEWVRLGCDDLHGFAIEASKAQPGRPSARERDDWFWNETAIAHLIGAAATALIAHESPLVQGLARRAMVPRIYMSTLTPDVDPFI